MLFTHVQLSRLEEVKFMPNSRSRNALATPPLHIYLVCSAFLRARRTQGRATASHCELNGFALGLSRNILVSSIHRDAKNVLMPGNGHCAVEGNEQGSRGGDGMDANCEGRGQSGILRDEGLGLACQVMDVMKMRSTDRLTALMDQDPADWEHLCPGR